jgi:broad specificity polyphosphatase/5'/3'-nucleotidase SurE
MPCPEHVRLRQLYEAARKHLGNVIWVSPQDELSGAAARLAAEIRMKADHERDEANARLMTHERDCTICNHRRQPALSSN